MIVKRLANKLVQRFELKSISTTQKKVYLTFDDGPEGTITDWILETLKSYSAKATFFCKGENAVKHPEQFSRLREEGHAIGNHTFSHIHSYKTTTRQYVADVDKADRVLNTVLFRPPWGSLTLSAFFKLRKKYKIVFWSLLSGDTEMGELNFEENMKRLYRDTRPGDIVLFHFCKKHEKETRMILPLYLDWLKMNGYTTDVLR